MTARRYLPWVRTGAASLLTGSWGPARATVGISAAVNGGDGPVTVDATLYGPGDVTGIDPRQIVRTEPPDGETAFEATLLPSVEFDEAALPWLFSPAAAADDRLRPWLVLVVVPASAATLETDSGHPTPVLSIPAGAGTELPDLNQSWAWAHAQVTGTGDPAGVVADPAQWAASLSRLVCPRRLTPDTAYLAAVVPATAQGLQAGLGQPVDPGDLLPAWTATTAFLELPVYHHWSFSTGPEGDFETLVGRLRRLVLPADSLRGRPLDLAPLRTTTGATTGSDTLVPGALGGNPTGPAAVDQSLSKALRRLLDLSAPTPAIPGAADLPLPLPTYGRWHAAARSAPAVGSATWLAQLNLEPAARAVAAIGTRVVQDLQEEMMTAAWQQAARIAAANQLLRQAQLARAAGQVMHVRLAAMSATGCVSVTSPVHDRVMNTVPAGTTVLATVRSSRVPPPLLGPGLRRALRARGPLGRRTGILPGALVTAVNDRVVTLPSTPPRHPPGTITVDSVSSDPQGGPTPPICSLTPARLAGIKLPNNQWQDTMKAIMAHQQYVGRCDPPPPRPRPRLPLDQLKTTLLAALDPKKTIPPRVAGRVTRPPDWHPPDELEPVLAAPELATPVYRAVGRIDPQLLLPAPEELPTNSVTSVGTTPWFIAAVMVGANAELCREMLWRGFPTDQRATSLRHFWDRTGQQPAPAPIPEYDIDPISDWDTTKPLSTHAGAGTAQTVVIIRGELLRRFPRTTIYLAKARRTQPGGNAAATYDLAPHGTHLPGEADYPERYAVFTGDLPPDITFLGFDISPEQAVGSDTEDDPGWYLVFQEPATETRLGLDAERPSDVAFATWAQLAWTDVTVTNHHLQLEATAGPAPTESRGLRLDGTGTSAQIAAALEQQPFRAAIHLSTLLEVS